MGENLIGKLIAVLLCGNWQVIIVSSADGDPSLASVSEYAIRELNYSLRHPGITGSEQVFVAYLGLLGFIQGKPGIVGDEQLVLQGLGAFKSSGISGAFECFWNKSTLDMVASVYAEIARRHGWASLDRLLDAGEWDGASHSAESWASQDRSLDETLAVFGQPSMCIGGTNPRWSKTLMYAAKSPSPALSFHFWNGPAARIGEVEYPEAMLLGIRREGVTFGESFSCTPLGNHYRETNTIGRAR